MLILRLLALAASPLRLSDWRSLWIENSLKIALTNEDERHLRIACTDAGKMKLGGYYHWYLQKLIISNTLRRGNRKQFRSLLKQADKTDYFQFDTPSGPNQGILIAIPHHGHYILSIIALAERIRPHRKVILFYGNPETHPGNDVFDHLNEWFWNDQSNINFAHDTRKGLATVMQELRSGAAVFIMPDVFKDESSTFVIPFCGRSLNIMLGTAVLARKTGAMIVPMISTPISPGIGFKSIFAPPVFAAPPLAKTFMKYTLVANDYRVMCTLFKFYEHHMKHQLIYWQNVRQHIAQAVPHIQISRPDVSRVTDLLESDPDILPPSAVIDLRQGCN